MGLHFVISLVVRAAMQQINGEEDRWDGTDCPQTKWCLEVKQVFKSVNFWNFLFIFLFLSFFFPKKGKCLIKFFAFHWPSHC